MPRLDAIAPIIWAKWGGAALEALRQAALEAADGLAFEAMNSDAGVRTILVVCTTDPTQVQAIAQALPPGTNARPVDWTNYSVAEMIFKTEKGVGISHQEHRDGNGKTAVIVCATRPGALRRLEECCNLSD